MNRNEIKTAGKTAETILKALKEGQVCQECNNFEADGIFYYHTESIVSGEKIFLCNGCFEEWYEVLKDEDNWVPLL